MIQANTETLRSWLKGGGRLELAARSQFEVETITFEHYLVEAVRSHPEYSEDDQRAWAAYCCLTENRGSLAQPAAALPDSSALVRTQNDLLAVMVQRSKDEEARFHQQGGFQARVLDNQQSAVVATELLKRGVTDAVGEVRIAVDGSTKTLYQRIEALEARLPAPMFQKWLIIAAVILLYVLLGVDIAKGQGFQVVLPVRTVASCSGMTVTSGVMTSLIMDSTGRLCSDVSGSTISVTIDTSSIASAVNQTNGNQKAQVCDAGGDCSTVTGGKLDVNATVSGSNPAASATGAAVPASASYNGTNIGGNLTGQTGTSEGAGVFSADVSVKSSALPTGASTAARQDTGNTSLGTIKTNTDPLVTAGGGGYVRQDSTATMAKESGGNLATIATNTTGVATAGNQTTEISSLSSINTNVDCLDSSTTPCYVQQNVNSPTLAKETGGNLESVARYLQRILADLHPNGILAPGALALRGSLGNIIGSAGDRLKVDVPPAGNPCNDRVLMDAAISQTASTKVISSGAGRVVICAVRIVAGAAEITSEWEGSGTTCGTGTIAHSGSTTAANGESFAANGGYQSTNLPYMLLPGNDWCVAQSGSNRVSGKVWFTRIPG